MALQLNKDLGTGVTASYWRISRLELLPDRVSCWVELYLDAAARGAGKQPFSETRHNWEGDDSPCTIANMDEPDSNPFFLCYEKLKTLPEFSGATDV